MASDQISPDELLAARTLLEGVLERCGRDRWAAFPTPVRERISNRDKLPGFVLMGMDGDTLEMHMRLVDILIASNPGMNIRAVVSDSPTTVIEPKIISDRGWTFLTTSEFFDQAAKFADCVAVDRYCTWLPTIKYRRQLKQLGMPVLRFEQFLNMPGLNPAGAYYKAQSDFALNHLDELLLLADSFSDAKSVKVLYNVLSAFISMNYIYFALSCDDYRERYFPSDVGFSFSDHEVLADIGALDGSESIIFAEKVNRKFKGIHAFEPDNRNFRKLCRKVNRYIAEHGDMNFYCHNFGIYDRNDYLGFTGLDSAVAVSAQRAENGQGLLMARLDDVLDEITLLRLEAEGAEPAALRGAAGLIKKFNPKLAVSVYHREDDLLVIPNMIREFDRGYSFKLRHQSLEQGILCLYCQ